MWTGIKKPRTKRDFKELCKLMGDEIAIFRASEKGGEELIDDMRDYIEKLEEDEMGSEEAGMNVARHVSFSFLNHLKDRTEALVEGGHRVEVPREDVKVMKDNVIDINNAKSNRGRK